ncbi:MAG: alanine racemase [Chloroflexi bacterium]|nr:alanine racemase [Chloroflexota bacterium]
MEQVTAGLLVTNAAASQVLVRQNRAWQQIVILRPDRPTWVEIDLGAIAQNTRQLKALAGPGVQLFAVLKADGYGHGALKVAQTALNNGADRLAVACLSEGVALRQAGIQAPILVLGYTPPWQAREMVRYQLEATLFSLDVAKSLSRAALALNLPARAHVKVDTGMGRLGLFPADVLPFVESLRSLAGLEITGLFSHLAAADGASAFERVYTHEQLKEFAELVRQLEDHGWRIPLRHIGNSAGLLSDARTGAGYGEQMRYNGIRVGIALVGLAPAPERPLPPEFRPALRWKTQVAQVKAYLPGSYIGYGCTYKTRGRQRIATIPVGYADGFRRAPQHWGHVLVRGQAAMIVGRVCMDQTMVDVTDIPHVRAGDEVVLIGEQGERRITAEDVARRLGTNSYEVVSTILARVPRVS